MSTEKLLQRREVVAGLAGLGAALAGADSLAQSAKSTDHADHVKKDASSSTPLAPEVVALINSATECVAAGRVCLARCTDHMATGMSDMADCQRAVMNMLPVVTATGEVAAYSNSAMADFRSLVASCARFCETCARECEPHVAHHEECRTCRDACLACAKACKALAA